MKIQSLAAVAALAAAPAIAQEHRELDAHEHGVSTLELAIEGDRLEMELRAPGMDIVGFEHAASSDDDKAAVEAALASLSQPARVIALPEAAGCSAIETEAEFEIEGHDHHEDHEAHAHEHDDDYDHDDHDDHHEDHEHDDAHDHGSDHADEHDHEHHGATHSEFHAAYAFACADPTALTEIGFPFFETFANAGEIEAQFVTDAGTGSAEITRDTRRLTLP